METNKVEPIDEDNLESLLQLREEKVQEMKVQRAAERAAERAAVKKTGMDVKT